MKYKHMVSNQIVDAIQFFEGQGLPFKEELEKHGMKYESLDISNTDGRYRLYTGHLNWIH